MGFKRLISLSSQFAATLSSQFAANLIKIYQEIKMLYAFEVALISLMEASILVSL